jgi:hypothetical protein
LSALKDKQWALGVSSSVLELYSEMFWGTAEVHVKVLCGSLLGACCACEDDYRVTAGSCAGMRGHEVCFFYFLHVTAHRHLCL